MQNIPRLHRFCLKSWVASICEELVSVKKMYHKEKSGLDDLSYITQLIFQQNNIQLTVLLFCSLIINPSFLIHCTVFNFCSKRVGGETSKTFSCCGSDFCPKQAGVLNTVTRVLRGKNSMCPVYCTLNRSCQIIFRVRKLMPFWLVLPAITRAGGNTRSAQHACGYQASECFG